MPTSRRPVRLRCSLTLVVVVSGLLTIFYISTIADDGNSSWMHAIWTSKSASSGFWWSALVGFTFSVFVPVRQDVRGVPAAVEVAAEVRSNRCRGKIDSDDDESDWNICQPLIAGGHASATNLPHNFTPVTNDEYARRTRPDNCDCFRSDLGYFMSSQDTSDDERHFPIAFSLLTYENLEQVLLLSLRIFSVMVLFLG